MLEPGFTPRWTPIGGCVLITGAFARMSPIKSGGQDSSPKLASEKPADSSLSLWWSPRPCRSDTPVLCAWGGGTERIWEILCYE